MSHKAKITEWFSTHPTLTVDEAATFLSIKATSAAVNLSRWAQRGDLIRVARGVYAAPKPAAGPVKAAAAPNPHAVLVAARESAQRQLNEASVLLDACRATIARLDAALAALEA